MENIILSLDSKYVVQGTSTADEALNHFNKDSFNLVIVDIKLPKIDGLTLIEQCKKKSDNTKYIAITGYSDEEANIRAVNIGVDYYLKKPYDESELHHSIEHLLHLQAIENENRLIWEILEKENIVLQKQLNRIQEKESLDLIGSSTAMQKCKSKAEKIAKHGLNTLIWGESGTGKEVFAKYIHRLSPRAKKPFIAINCAALSPSLFESELFGYEKGAFTGAREPQAGLFEIANSGILFLDEITEIPQGLQAKLLRAVETKSVRRLGSTNWTDVDVQIISSTNRDVNDALSKGILRNDLYHRLADGEIYLPPLRERNEDLQELLQFFVTKYEKQFQVKAPKLKDAQIKLLKKQNWGGNIRQLSNFVKKLCLFGNEIDEEDFLDLIFLREESSSQDKDMIFHFRDGSLTELEDAKRWLVEKAMINSGGNKSAAARHLGITYQGLLKMMKGF